MTIKFDKILGLFFILLFIVSCKQDPCLTKDQFLSSFDSFTNEFDKRSKDLTIDEKIEFESRYQEIVNNCYKKFKQKLTLKEKQAFWQASLNFYLKRYDGNIGKLLSDADNDPFRQYVKEEIEELIEISGSDFINSVAEIFEDELPKLIEDIKGSLERIGEDLIKLFEN